MSNRVRKDEDVFDMGRETPEGTERAVHDSPGNVLDPCDDLDWIEKNLPELEGSGELTSMRFVPAEEIDEALEELFGGDYDHRHDGNAICPSCGGQFIAHYRFLLPCRANDIGKDDFVPVCEPQDDYFAFREDDGTLVVESPEGEQWAYCSYESNTEDIHAECSRSVEHSIWNCKPLGKKDPVTEDYMRSISS